MMGQWAAKPPAPPVPGAGKKQPLLAEERGGRQRGSVASTGTRRASQRPSRRRIAQDGTPMKLTQAEKMERYVESAASLSEDYSPKCAGCLRQFSPVCAVVLTGLFWVARLYYILYTWAYAILKKLPTNQLQMVIGLTLCFFGGTYVTLIAAIEAFRTMGGEQLYSDLEFIGNQIEVWKDEHIKDDQKDEDGDGIADVDQINANELWKRKAKLFMVSVEEPTELQSAIGSLWSACLGVLACLMFQFAQTIGYALAISEMIGPTVCFLCAPGMQFLLGKDLEHWNLPIITTVVKVFCVLLVWTLEKVRAAFYSGIRGGRLFAEGLINILEQGKADDSHLDEYIAYPLAAVGFMFQVSSYFMVPFPLDWVLWPVTMVEHYLELQVAWSWSGGAAPVA